MATATLIPANYGMFQINDNCFIHIGPVIHEMTDKQDAQNQFTGAHQVCALETQISTTITPFLTNLIIATANMQPRAPLQMLKPKKVLAKKLRQFKGD